MSARANAAAGSCFRKLVCVHVNAHASQVRARGCRRQAPLPFRADEGPRRTGQLFARAGLTALHLSRSIAHVSRRTTPTPGERVNGAVSRHATLGKRRVVRQVLPPEHQARSARASSRLPCPPLARHQRGRETPCGLLNQRAGACDQRPRRARSVAILRRCSRRACATCSRAAKRRSERPACLPRPGPRIRAARLAIVAPRSSSYGDRRGPRACRGQSRASGRLATAAPRSSS